MEIKIKREWRERGEKRCICECYCGKEFEARLDNVKSGRTRSCGCRKRGVSARDYERFEEVYEEKGGVVREIAKEYGVSRQSIYKEIRRRNGGKE